MYKKRNPYVVGPPITEDSQFYGRQEMIEELISSSSRGIFIKGNRRMGKTSLLKKVERLLLEKEGVIPVFISLQGCTNAEAMGSALIRRIQKRCRDFSFNNRKHIVQVIEQWDDYCSEKNVNSTLLLDEAEELLNLSMNDISRLRNVLLDQTDQLTVILTATRKLLDLFEYDSGYTSSFLLGLAPKNLSLLKRAEAINLIRQTSNPAGEIYVEENTIDEILHYCGGHPFLIQRMCDKLFDNINGRLDEFSSKNLISDISLDNWFKIDFGNLYPLEQDILQQFSFDKPITESELKNKIGVPENHLLISINELLNLGFIQEAEEKTYVIGNYFLAQWLGTSLVKDSNKSLLSKKRNYVQNPVRIFISYAHEDEDWKERLMGFFAPLIRKGDTEIWHDRQIPPGEKWAKIIEQRLKRADIALFLVSPDALHSDYIMDIELPAAMKQLAQQQIKLAPVILRHCLWKETQFRDMQVIQKNDKPILDHLNQDEAFMHVSSQIHSLIKECLRSR